MKKLIAAMIGAGLALGAAPAFAGDWRFDPRRCPDIREDWRDARENRRDERNDYGRRDRIEDRYDRRESRRDRAVTICPRSAFYYVQDRRDRRGGDGRDERWDDNGWRDGYDRDRDRYRGRAWTPQLPVKYDRRMRMQYTTVTGRKIYIRG
ncbi:MAG TPA: hypothetical protein PKM48_04790 [Parvularculaceae bacterium]|nr:hypothetical protein [Parvularculaceae bacterium]HNS85446.1 hypothetical protein [Parvularculaceae bacterium]